MKDPARVLLLLLSLGLIGALWCVPYVATHDGPNHLADCVLADRLDDPGSGLDKYLERGTPISSLGFQAICASTEPLVGWRWAYRISIAVIALSFALGYFYLARGIARLGQKDSNPFELLGFAYALPWCFYMGFFDSLFASALSLWVLGFLVRTPRPNAARWAALSGALVVVALVHVFTAALLGVLCALLIGLRAPPGERIRALAITILIGLPAMAIALSARGGADIGTTAWHPWAVRLIDLAETFLGGPLARTWLPVGLGVVSVVAALASFRRIDPAHRAIAVFSALSLVIFFVSPYNLATWAYFSPRTVFLGLALAPLALPGPAFDHRGERLAATLAVAAAALGSIAWSASFHLQMEPLVEEALGGLDAPLHRDGPRLPMMFVREPKVIAEVEPLVMIGHLYLFDQGGVDPYLYADQPLIDPIVYKDDPKKLFGEFPVRFVRESFKCAGTRPSCPPLDIQYEWLAIWGKRFDDVILFADDPALRQVFLERGYAIDFERRRLSILHARSCRIDLRIVAEGSRVLGAPLRLRVGRSKIDQPMVEDRIPAEAVVPSGGLPLAIEGPDCGALWVDVSWVGTSSTGSAPGSACAEAGDQGRVRVQAQPGAPVEVRCTLRSRSAP